LESLKVELGERSYPIHIGAGLLDRGDLIQPHLRGNQVCIVTNETVAPLYLVQLQAILKLLDRNVKTVILPDGEQFKTLETVSIIFDRLLEFGFSRSATLIALGGGVIGDMTGFAAATYQRGINFIQIPTTLLSQVDSSVGGKTGVNRPLGKNMVGAFYQPRCVLIDTTTLNTLPDRELKAGLAEVIKYGLINKLEFLAWLEHNMPALLRREPAALAYSIKTSCEAKATIVAADETETGLRAILNLGHTFGHAIETAMGYGVWLHGEAVAAGMVMAADLSWRLGLLTQAEAARTKRLIASAGLPVAPPAIPQEAFIRFMSKDKKADEGKIRFILLQGLGKAGVREGVDGSLLAATLAAGPRLTAS
jgi:3-dehydroquinate synthase